MAPLNVIRYVGEGFIPQDVKRRRKQVMSALQRFGTPVIIKHMFNDLDVQEGLAQPSPNYQPAYGQTRNSDPLSHGMGFCSVETMDGEWVAPDGTLVISATNPGAGYTPAPKYRGFGQGFLTYVIEPDTAQDLFKLTDVGALIKVQTATAQTGWYPDMNDNDLLINVTLDRYQNVIDSAERYQLKQTNPISMRGLDRRGQREYSEDGGNRFIVNQTFQMTEVPSNNELMLVEIDR